MAYVEPSRRPADGRYGENPNRVHQHHQFQVILSLRPTMSRRCTWTASGRWGWIPAATTSALWRTTGSIPCWAPPDWDGKCGCDGMEITQFTYFQQVGGLEADPVSVELTYGLERLALYLQDKESVYDLEWVEGVTYGDVFRQAEYEHSKYSFEVADTDLLFRLFDDCEREALRALEAKLVLPAYDWVLKCSHTFNLLEARGAISGPSGPVTSAGCAIWRKMRQSLRGRAGTAGISSVERGEKRG